jgi:exopolysaccharide production protein ExoZ
MPAAPFFPGIHALRAAAATLVVIEHAAYVANDYSWISFASPYFYYGRIGVILFFAISGFVIALQRTRPAGAFAIHRLLRIYPGYWLAMVIAAIMLTATGSHVSANAPSLLLYPSSAIDGSLHIPYWTLTFEITFYALAAIAFACRLSDRTLTVLALAWIAAVNLFASNPADPTAYEFPGLSILLSAPVQVFPMGLICGIHFDRLKRAGRGLYLIACVAVFGCSLAFAELTVTKLLLQGVSACLLLLAVADLDIRSRLVELLGNASYGIYLMHFPAMMLATAVLPPLGMPWFFLIGIASGTAFGLFDHWLYRRAITQRFRIGDGVLQR